MAEANHLMDGIRDAAPAPDHVFLETPDGDALGYGEAMDRAGRLANALIGLGLEPGDRVALKVEKSVPALLLYLAVVRAGGVILPLNPAYTPAETAYFLADAEPRILICDPGAREDLEGPAAEAGVGRVECLDGEGQGEIAARAESLPPEFDDRPRGPDDLAAILYTSGTTGRAKGAMLTHDNLASNARSLVEAWKFGTDDVLLHALPIFHTHGLFVATNVTLFSGAQILFLPKFDADRVVEVLPRATVMMGVPTYYARLLANPRLTEEAARHMRLFISGSAPLSAEVHKEFHARTGHAILERYGMSETSMNTSNPYRGERRPGTVGFPLAGVEVRITDLESGRPLERGEVGMIEVRGPNVFPGYWRMPERKAEDFREDGFFITGDLGVMDMDGYLSIVGREKDLIISGGLNVYPAEVEAAIEEIDGVAECAVIGVPHDDFGEGVFAVIALKPGRELTEKDVLAALKARLAGFKRPKDVAFVPALPRNAMGKVEKAALREIYRGAFTA